MRVKLRYLFTKLMNKVLPRNYMVSYIEYVYKVRVICIVQDYNELWSISKDTLPHKSLKGNFYSLKYLADELN